MSDEVRSNSSPAAPDAGAKPVDPVDGPQSLEIEFPTPDVEIPDSSPMAAPLPVALPVTGPVPVIVAGVSEPGPTASGATASGATASGATASGPTAPGPDDPNPTGGEDSVIPLAHSDVTTLRPQVGSELSPARHSERPPPPPSQRPAHLRPEGTSTPVPPGSATLPAPAVHTLPAPAPLAPPSPAVAPVVAAPFAPAPFAPFASAPLVPGPLASAPGIPGPLVPVPETESRVRTSPRDDWGWTPPAPHVEPAVARMHSEPVPLVTKAAAAPHKTNPPSKNTLRPGLVEPKRIIEVLGSNVPVLDTALEEESIEDLDDSEAHELNETPVPEHSALRDEPELELNVVVEDFPPSIDVPIEAPATTLRGAPPAPRATVLETRSIESPSAESPSVDSPSGDAAGADASRDASGADAGDAGPEAGGDNSTEAAEGDGAGAPSPSADGVAEPGDAAAGDAALGKRTKAPPNRRRRPPPPSSRANEKPKPELAPPGARKWWEEMFSEEFLRAIPILSPRQLEREVNFIDEALAVARGGRILDLACGAGQHAVELATRGYDLVGFDLSQSQLDWAGGLAQERNQRLQFTYGDMRELSYNEAFDALYCWNTSFGFFEEEKNVDVASRMFRALRPGGRILLDVINRDFVVAQQPGQTWFEGDGCVCIDDVAIDFITSRMKVKRTLMLTNGKNRECNYSVRIYGLHELGKILHDVGFKVLNVSGRPEMPGVFFGAASPRIIILAVKP